MKVIVSGASGFVGGHVVSELLRRDHQVTALVRDLEKTEQFAWGSQVRFVAWDIHSSKRLNLHEVGVPDVLIHLAWSGLPNYKERFHFETNLPAHYHFIKSLVEQGVSQVMVAGTCFEYGMQEGCLSESMFADPQNPYALAKDSLRKFLQCLQRDISFTLQWTRLFYMYGRGQNSNSILAQLDAAIERGDPAFNMSGGEQLRDYLPVEEVARCLVRLMENRTVDGLFNICSGQPVSIRELVETHLMKRHAKIRLNLGHYPYPDYEPMEFWGDRSRFNAALGIHE